MSVRKVYYKRVLSLVELHLRVQAKQKLFEVDKHRQKLRPFELWLSDFDFEINLHDNHTCFAAAWISHNCVVVEIPLTDTEIEEEINGYFSQNPEQA